MVCVRVCVRARKGKDYYRVTLSARSFAASQSFFDRESSYIWIIIFQTDECVLYYWHKARFFLREEEVSARIASLECQALRRFYARCAAVAA